MWVAAQALEAELESVRRQLHAKFSDEHALRRQLTDAAAAHAQREGLFSQREAEMRRVTQKALAMVSAMRGAAASLSAHSQAHAVLDSHFRSLEQSLRGAER